MARRQGFWERREVARRDRRVATWCVVALLGVAAVPIILTIADGEPGGAGIALLIAVEAIVAIPLVRTLRWRRRASAELRRTDQPAEDLRREQAAELVAADEHDARLRRLVDQLPEGPARDAAGDAARAAAASNETRRALVARRNELVRLRDASSSTRARRSLQRLIDASESDLRTIAATVDELGAAIAELVDHASEESLQRELDRLVDATRRADAIADGLAELNAAEQPR